MDGIKKIVAILALAAILAAFTAPAVAQQAGMQQGMQKQDMQGTMQVQSSNKDMMATMSDMKDASLAAAIITATGMESTLATGNHTLFVPTDNAIRSRGMDISQMGQAMSDQSQVKKTMQGFMMDKMVMPSELSDGKTLTMMDGKTLTVRKMNGQIMIDSAKITKAVQTNNGMIYMIDSVPQSMMSMAQMNK